MPKLSVIVITHNEAENIVPALESVRFADEWIVVDSGSTDDTVERAARWGAAVHVHRDWQGFGPQKNRALAYATGDWVLSIDADERLTLPLTAEIQRVVADPAAADGYTMRRSSSYCGRFMRFGGWWPDPVLRLFRRGLGRFSDDLVHEGVRLNGTLRHLQGHLIHYSYTSLESVIEKINTYSSAGAAAMLQRQQAGGIARGVAHAMWAFARAYVFRAGFLDGTCGFLAAVAGAEGTFYRYVKRAHLADPTLCAVGRSSGDAPPARAQFQAKHPRRDLTAA